MSRNKSKQIHQDKYQQWYPQIKYILLETLTSDIQQNIVGLCLTVCKISMQTDELSKHRI